jgi:hypothetical protein
MASIFSRKLRDGSLTWRMQIRRVGVPYYTQTFYSFREAKRWVKEHEKRYINDPDKYLSNVHEFRLSLRRQREFR